MMQRACRDRGPASRCAPWIPDVAIHALADVGRIISKLCTEGVGTRAVQMLEPRSSPIRSSGP